MLGLEPHVFADGDELHLRGDDALAGIPELGDGVAFAGLQRLALGVDGGLERAEEAFALGGGIFGVVFGEVAIVAGLDGAAFIRGDVATAFDPGFAQGREAGLDGALVIRIAPGAGGVINTDGGVFLDLAIEALGGAELDLAHGDADVLVDLPLDIDAGGGGELLAGVSFEGVFGGDHEEEFAEQTLAMAGLVCGCWQWMRKMGAIAEGRGLPCQALRFLRATPFGGMTRNQVRRVSRAGEISAPAMGRPCRNREGYTGRGEVSSKRISEEMKWDVVMVFLIIA